jgi:hypothetical protein
MKLKEKIGLASVEGGWAAFRCRSALPGRLNKSLRLEAHPERTRCDS